MENLDHEGFSVPDESAFYVLMSIYSRACKVYIYAFSFRHFIRHASWLTNSWNNTGALSVTCRLWVNVEEYRRPDIIFKACSFCACYDIYIRTLLEAAGTNSITCGLTHQQDRVHFIHLTAVFSSRHFRTSQVPVQVIMLGSASTFWRFYASLLKLDTLCRCDRCLRILWDIAPKSYLLVSDMST